MSTKSSTAPEEAHQTPQDTSNNLIAESLLSISKDNRYIQQCQHLLLNALEPIIGSNNVSEAVKTGTWYASYLLYLHLVVTRSGRSLGMESTGLSFTGTKNNERRRVFLSLWILGLSSFLLDYYFATTSSDSRETLRGTDRRRMHDRMRQQMLQRAAQQRQHTSANEQFSEPNSQHSNSSIKTFVSFVAGTMKAILGPPTPGEGPHSPHINQVVNSTFSLVSWVLRLHLAQYCITGKYPSVLHRILKVQHEQTTGTVARIKNTPNTMHIVGLVIGMQAVVSIARTVANRLAESSARLLYSTTAPSEAELRSRQDRLFQHDREVHPSKSRNSCAICRAERTHAAAPSSCGHVFCWNCLIQWVTTVRPECPMCRVKCRAQDILPLYNYDGETNT